MNYILPIIIGLIINGALGTVWYGPIFGKQWMKLKELKEEDLKGGGAAMGLIMLTSLGGLLLYTYLYKWLDVNGVYESVKLALIMATFAAFIGFNNVVYDRPGGFKKRFQVWFLYVGYTILTLGLTGAIFGILA